MTFSAQRNRQSLESGVAEFFRRSVGDWRSQRRYYTLKSDETQEVVSFLTVRFLEQGNPELIQLAQAHNLDNLSALTCGALTTWESNYSSPVKKQSTGSTVFGVLGNLLYRDRGFATPKPITAEFSLPEAATMRLVTQYNGSKFEEELKLIGGNYRTRQTIISRAGEEQMIGQYLERRVA